MLSCNGLVHTLCYLPTVKALTTGGALWLLAGGAAYTLGAVLYANRCKTQILSLGLSHLLRTGQPVSPYLHSVIRNVIFNPTIKKASVFKNTDAF